jgi:branched-subunit amino acid transport protein AzlD
MPDWLYTLLCIFVSAGITWTLRAAPFAALAPLRNSGLLEYLGEHMPVGIIFILTAYTLKDADVGDLGTSGITVLALAITVGLHVWRSSMMLSIFGGTGVYVVLASVIAA